MKASVLHEDLLHSLSVVGRSVGSRPTLPVLGHVLIKAEEDGHVTLVATNLEIFSIDKVLGKVETAGAITVPYRLFNDLVGAIAGGEGVRIDLFTNEDHPTILNVKWPGNEANINGIEAQQFPLLPTVGEGGVELDIDTFKAMVRNVAFSAATDESRPILTGVLVKIADGEILMAAADGFRLSVDKRPGGEATGETVSAIVPAKALSNVEWVLGRKDVEYERLKVSINSAKSQVIFAIEPGTVVVSQVLDGVFVNYSQIVPKSSTIKVTMSVKAFRDALKPIAVFARNEANVVHLATEGRKVVTLTATSAEMGDSRSEVETVDEIEGYETDTGFVIAFNCQYLLDMLSAAGAGTLIAEFTTNARPGKFSIKDEEWMYVLMPMHVRKR
jgi:DNA polymerase-3 subunit beta